MLENLITSKVRRKLLALFLLNPKSRFYLREICRRISEQPNAVAGELAKLQKIRLIASERSANLVYYSADARCPIYGELRGLVIKTEGIGAILQEEFEKAGGAKFAFVYGSVARGEEGPKSDIDVMIVGKVPPGSLVSAISKLEKMLGREINYLIYPEHEFLQKQGSGFLRDVMAGKKIMLAGDADELERFAKKR